MEIVTVRNCHDVHVFKGQFEGRWYRIGCGDEAHVPAGAARIWFGDWALPNELPNGQKPRRDAMERLRTYYGAYHNDEMWEENRPQVEVYEFGTENRLPVVLNDNPDDPFADPQVDEHTKAMFQTRISELERELASVTNIVTAQERAEASTAAASTGKTARKDGPSQVKKT